MFLMDELLYYARDENQFLRRRRTFVLALSPDLVETRFKDAELPYQRGVMLLGLLHVLVKKLIEWLSTDALNFQILFLGEGESDPLANERAILTKLFYEEIALDVVHVERLAPGKLARRCEEWARRSMVHVLDGRHPARGWSRPRTPSSTASAVGSPRPELGDGPGELRLVEGDDASDCWAKALQQMLMRWI